MCIVELKRSVLSVLVLASLMAVVSVVSLKLSFEVPEAANLLILEAASVVNCCNPVTIAAPQNKIIVSALHEAITKDPIISYLAKQEKSPPFLAS